MTLPVWGCPWRGLWRSGALELPNGSTRPAPGLSGVDPGDTFLQRMPWAPGATRTPEEAAADAAAGRQWPDYFLLSGTGRYIYGQLKPWSVEGWVYAAPDGTAWQVQYADLTVFPGSFDGRVIVSRIGAYAPDAAEHEYPLMLADNGLGSPVLPDIVENGAAIPGGVGMYMRDIRPDGSAAIISIEHDAVHGAGSGNCLKSIPVIFYLLELSGTPGVDFAASISVLYSKAQTLGTTTDSGKLPVFEEYYYDGNGAMSPAIISDPAEGEVIAFTPRTVVPNEVIDTGGHSPAAFGYPLYPGTFTRTIEVTGQILAAWFDPATGDPVPVYADTRLHWRDERSTLQQIGSGTLSATKTSAGLESVVNTLGWSVSYTETIEKDFRITLRCGASEVESQLTEVYQHDYSATWSASFFIPSGSGDYLVSQSKESESSVVTRTTVTPEGSTSEPGTLGVFTGQRADWRYLDPLGLTRQIYLIEPYAFFAWSGFGNDSKNELGILRYSNNMLAPVWRLTNATQYDTWLQGECLTPAGVVAGSITTSSGARYGTWHPVTHEIERRAAPCCWV